MTKQQRLVLVVSVMASFVAFLDGAIVNVALPAIQHQLGGGLSVQQWVVDAYLLTLSSLMLIAGSLSDLLGRKKILVFGLAGFGVTSLLCALAPSGGLLIIFRALQGVTGALLVPSSLALIISTFKGAAQGRAVGIWTAWTGIAFVIGPLLGGVLVDTTSWRWIFAINVLPIAVTLYLLRQVKSGEREPSEASIDVIGALLCALGLGGPVFALIEHTHYGWNNPLIYVSLVGGLILAAAFLLYERRVKDPMLSLSLFKNHNFSVGNIATLTIYAGLTAATFLIVIFVQQVVGYSALLAGLSLLPITLIMFVLSPRFGALAGRYGPRFFMGLGPLVAGSGFVLVAGAPVNLHYWTQLFPGIVIFGLGLSATVAPLTAAILGDVPSEEAGIASAVNNAIARVAGLIAIAAVGAIVSFQFGRALSHNSRLAVPAAALSAAKRASLVTTPPRPYAHDPSFRSALNEASVSAFRAGMLTTAGLIMAGGAISLIGIKNPGQRQTA